MLRFIKLLSWPVALFIFLSPALCHGAVKTTAAATAVTTSADLLNGHDWQHFTGATVTGAGIMITPLAKGIVPQVSVPTETKNPDAVAAANDPPTPNSPINLRGPRLLVTGDFSISMVLDANQSKGAFLYLYGTLPIIYDEWRQEGKTLGLGLKNGKLTVNIWNGKSSDPITKTFGSGLTSPANITVSRTGSSFIFQVNGKQLGQMADPGLFKNGEIVFGADAELGGGFTINQLTVQATSTSSKVTIVDREPLMAYPITSNSLRSVAASRSQPIYIGGAVAAIPLITDKQYQALVAQQFSMLTPENDMKFQFIHPQQNIYAFNEADALVEFAQLNNIRIHGHALVWHEALPKWLTGVTRTSAEVKQILSDHIRTVVGRYKGKIAEWDVVNEPLKDMNLTIDLGVRSGNPWFQSMGESYIDFAFREANAADPSARLYLNEYGIEEPGKKFDVLYALVKRLLARGVPIHGIGFQMHEDMEKGQYVGSEPKLVATNMKKIAALGLEVRISEMDVNLNSNTPTASLLKVQGTAFHDMLAMGLQQTGFKSFGQWGITDRYSSLSFDYNTFGNGLMFDVNYQPKTAHSLVLQALQGN